MSLNNAFVFYRFNSLSLSLSLSSRLCAERAGARQRRRRFVSPEPWPNIMTRAGAAPKAFLPFREPGQRFKRTFYPLRVCVYVFFFSTRGGKFFRGMFAGSFFFSSCRTGKDDAARGVRVREDDGLEKRRNGFGEVHF